MANGDLDAVVRAMPQFKALGPLFKSSEPVKLTEEETEYSISAVKHMYARHLLLQFNCTNTVEEQVLEDVAVTVDLAQAVRIILLAVRPAAMLGCGRAHTKAFHCGKALLALHGLPRIRSSKD